MENRTLSNPNKVRKVAMNIIYNITENKAYANLAIDKTLKGNDLSRPDKSLVTEIVNGTIRMLKHLDWVLNLFLAKNVSKQNPWIKTILRMSLYQILFMDKVPNYAAVNEAVELARKKTNHNLSSLVNGVLRNIIRNMDNITYPAPDTIEYLAVYHSHPEWLVANLINNYGIESCAEVLAYNNQRPKLHIRTNTLLATPEELLNELIEMGIDCELSSIFPQAIIINNWGNNSLDQIPAYKKGNFYIQNIASMLAAPILTPEPTEQVYDLCCGVGGKATHMAQLMNNTGNIYCYDIYPSKLTLLEKNAHRLGIKNLTINLEDVLKITEEQVADKVLLDAPCSGLGVLNRRADLRFNKTLDDLQELVNLQNKLLIKASQIVKKGGYILYATCTINKRENEDVVQNFLLNNNEFELMPLDARLSFFPFTDEDYNKAQSGLLTIIPGRYGTDGMFYALLRRKGAN